MKPKSVLICVMALFLAGFFGSKSSGSKGPYLSPCALVSGTDGKVLYVAEASASRIDVFDLDSHKVTRSLDLAAEPTGLALAPAASRLYVTCGLPVGTVQVLDAATGKLVETLTAGYGACAPVLSPDGTRLFVCNRFNHDVSILDLASRRELGRVPVLREPIAAALTPDGACLFVANHLPDGRADVDEVFAKISVIDVAAKAVKTEIPLPNGSTSVRGICIAPDGSTVYVTHILARFHMPTTQLERGWMNTNALTLIDAKEQKAINTVLLDDVDSGAANPWGVGCTADSATLCVAHAGSQELSVINVPKLLEKLAKMPKSMDEVKSPDYTAASIIAADVPNDLSYLVDLRQRLRLPGNGPRALAVVGNRVFTAHYFTDSLSEVPLPCDSYTRAVAYALAPEAAMTPARKGELLFNDATMCFQQWQSCATCHPDARVDGLNWDLLNDGMGNPKNTRSMLWAHRTPPAMSHGIRDTAETAVRAGIKFIQFAVRPEEDACAIDEYLKSLEPVPSPYLVKGKLGPEAKRGEKLFNSKDVGCFRCHPSPLFTDQKPYDMGMAGEMEKTREFDTSTLTECWRTRPFLFDGRAATLRDVLKACNADDKHGRTSKLSDQQLADLEKYILSL